MSIKQVLIGALIVTIPVAAWAAWQYKTGVDLQHSIEVCSGPHGLPFPGYTMEETRRMCVVAEMHALGH